MLQSIRDRATGVFAWVIVILLIVPFALWGIQEYLGGGPAVNVAEVNDVSISRNNLNIKVDTSLRGKKNRPEGAALTTYRRRVLDEMIQEEVLYQAALDRGFRIHEAIVFRTIQSNPVFQKDGKFDPKLYKDLLKYNGLAPESYQATLAREMLIQQFIGSIVGTSYVTSVELDKLIKLQRRKLDLAVIQVPFKTYSDKVTVTDAQVKAYYEKHKQNFMTPARVKVDYLMLSVEQVASDLKFTEAQLKEYFDTHQDSFLRPEQRHLAHILIEIPADAKSAAIEKARKQAEDIYQQLQNGADFAKMAQKYSQDAGSANQGGDIGVLEPGTLDKVFEQAAVALKKGQYSKPVRTAFGFQIVKLVDIKQGESKSFAEARADVEKMYRRQQAGNLFFDRKEALYNQTYENPEGLEIAARQLGLKIKTSAWFSRSGLPDDPVAYDPNLVKIAFSGDVFAAGVPARSLNSKLIELKENKKTKSKQVVVIRLSDYQPSKELPLEKVRDEITKTLKAKEADKRMQADLESWLKVLKQKGQAEQFAKDKSFKLIQAGFVGRSDNKLDGGILTAAFKAPRPTKDKVSYTFARARSGDGALIAIRAVQSGVMKKNDPTRPFFKQFTQRIKGTAELAAFVESLKQQASISIYENQLAKDTDDQ